MSANKTYKPKIKNCSFQRERKRHTIPTLKILEIAEELSVLSVWHSLSFLIIWYFNIFTIALSYLHLTCKIFLLKRFCLIKDVKLSNILGLIPYSTRVWFKFDLLWLNRSYHDFSIPGIIRYTFQLFHDGHPYHIEISSLIWYYLLFHGTTMEYYYFMVPSSVSLYEIVSIIFIQRKF